MIKRHLLQSGNYVQQFLAFLFGTKHFQLADNNIKISLISMCIYQV